MVKIEIIKDGQKIYLITPSCVDEFRMIGDMVPILLDSSICRILEQDEDNNNG